MTTPTPQQLQSDPFTSFWLKDALRTALSRDCVDALHDAELLVRVLQARLPGAKPDHERLLDHTIALLHGLGFAAAAERRTPAIHIAYNGRRFVAGITNGSWGINIYQSLKSFGEGERCFGNLVTGLRADCNSPMMIATALKTAIETYCH